MTSLLLLLMLLLPTGQRSVPPPVDEPSGQSAPTPVPPPADSRGTGPHRPAPQAAEPAAKSSEDKGGGQAGETPVRKADPKKASTKDRPREPGTVQASRPGAVSPPPVRAEYMVGPEDVLRITVIGEPDLSKDYRVNGDGEFEFPWIGAVRASGMTVRAIEAAMTQKLEDGYMRQPQVTVEVVDYRSQRIYVAGEVRTPGQYPFKGSMTLLDVLTQAGWTPASASDEIQVIHPRVGAAGPMLPTANANADIVRVSIAELQSGKLLSFQIRDGDTIYVPKAPTFFIGGQVRSPGEYTIRPGMTVQQALVIAGGASDRGATGRVKVTRAVNGKLKKLSIELTDKVQPGDVIEVPQRFF